VHASRPRASPFFAPRKLAEFELRGTRPARRTVAELSVRNVLGRLLVLFLAIPLAGCVTLDLLVRVWPDGSGEIVRTIVLRKDWIDELRKSHRSDGQTAVPEFGLYSKEDAEWEATQMGQGVQLVETTPTKTATGRGVTCTYSFPDVRKLTLSASPPSWWKGSGPDENSDPIRFDFHRQPDGVATLSIRLPQGAVAAPASPAPGRRVAGAIPADQREVMRSLFEGFRTVARVELVGSVVRVEGGWRNENRVMLFDFDFGRLLSDDALLRRLIEAPRESPGALLHGVPGCRVPDTRNVTISFR